MSPDILIQFKRNTTINGIDYIVGQTLVIDVNDLDAIPSSHYLILDKPHPAAEKTDENKEEGDPIENANDRAIKTPRRKRGE